MPWFNFLTREPPPQGIWLTRQVLVWDGARISADVQPDFQFTGDPQLPGVYLFGFSKPHAAECARARLGSSATPTPRLETLTARHLASAALLNFAQVGLDWDLPTVASFELSESLLRLRDLLRPRQPSPVVAGLPLLCVDTFARAAPHQFYIRGWLRDCHGPLVRLTAISPEGLAVPLTDRLSFTPRTDIRPFFPGDTYTGFLTAFTWPRPSLLAAGWLLEIETAGGFIGETAVPTVVTDREQALHRVLADLTLEAPPRPNGVATQVDQFVQQVLVYHRHAAQIVHDRQFGPATRAPQVSVLVPLYDRVDLLEHQVVQFARDPGWRDCELIYLLDSPEATATVLGQAAALSTLYQLPLRVITFNSNLGFATINNWGARLARADLLLFLNSDVLPIAPGWIARLAATYRADDTLGALGPKLLYEDDSLQHAGENFTPNPDGFGWDCLPLFKGLHRDFAPANQARTVPAVTAACLMIARNLFLQQGGFDEGYVQGDYEDSDLCLRLQAAGRHNAYAPAVELYHLEGVSYPADRRCHQATYNRWRHSQRWNRDIAALDPLLADAAHPTAPARPAIPRAS